MRESHNFKKLEVYQRSVKLAIDIYQICTSFPKDEKYGLISQIKRSAISFPSNISEGAGRSTAKDVNRFFDIALGSANELYTQLLISNKLGFIDEDQFNFSADQLTIISKMIVKFKNRSTNI